MKQIGEEIPEQMQRQTFDTRRNDEALKKIEKSLESTKNNTGSRNHFRKKPQTNGSTASIKPSETEEHEEDPDKFFKSDHQEEKTISFGFGCHNLQASTLPLLNEDTIPNWE